MNAVPMVKIGCESRRLVYSAKLECVCMSAGVKYDVKVTRTAHQAFRLHMGSNYVDIVGRKLNDGGLLIQVCAAVQSFPKISQTDSRMTQPAE